MTKNGSTAKASPPVSGLVGAIASNDRFRMNNALGPGMFLDAGLPLGLFTVVYMVSGNNLTVAAWIALGSGLVLGVVRLLRRDSLQNVVAGFIGVGIAVFLALRTGQAQDAFLFGFLINIVNGVAHLVSLLVRWPLIGVVVGLVLGQGMSWRRDSALRRAYMIAGALWVGLFAARLAVQLPLYWAGEEQLGWLAGARLVMGAPFFVLVAYLSWVIIRPAYHAHQERQQQGMTPPT